MCWADLDAGGWHRLTHQVLGENRRTARICLSPSFSSSRFGPRPTSNSAQPLCFMEICAEIEVYPAWLLVIRELKDFTGSSSWLKLPRFTISSLFERHICKASRTLTPSASPLPKFKLLGSRIVRVLQNRKQDPIDAEGRLHHSRCKGHRWLLLLESWVHMWVANQCEPPVTTYIHDIHQTKQQPVLT